MNPVEVSLMTALNLFLDNDVPMVVGADFTTLAADLVEAGWMRPMSAARTLTGLIEKGLLSADLKVTEQGMMIWSLLQDADIQAQTLAAAVARAEARLHS
jgi:hypothetical protein